MPQDNPNVKEFTPFLDDHIGTAEFLPDGRTIMLASNESIYLYDVEREQELFRMPCTGGPKKCVVSPDGRLVAIGLWRGGLSVRELATGHELYSSE